MEAISAQEFMTIKDRDSKEIPRMLSHKPPTRNDPHWHWTRAAMDRRALIGHVEYLQARIESLEGGLNE